jgi:hypothetical protein
LVERKGVDVDSRIKMKLEDKIKNIMWGIEHTIAHCVSHNLYYDLTFDVEDYLNGCRELFNEMGLEQYLIDEIIDEGHTQGLQEFEDGSILKRHGWGASSIRPEVNPKLIKDTMDLIDLLKQSSASTIGRK